MMKNDFYFTLKYLFVLKIFKFLSSLFGHVAKRLNQKDKAISKLMTSQPEKQTIAMHILPIMIRSKDNQKMKLGQLIEYDTRNIFLEPDTKCGEIIPRYFSEKSKLSTSLGILSNVSYQFYIIVCQVEGYRKILKLSCRPLGSTSYRAFLKNKKMSGTSLSTSFSP